MDEKPEKGQNMKGLEKRNVYEVHGGILRKSKVQGDRRPWTFFLISRHRFLHLCTFKRTAFVCCFECS